MSGRRPSGGPPAKASPRLRYIRGNSTAGPKPSVRLRYHRSTASAKAALASYVVRDPQKQAEARKSTGDPKERNSSAAEVSQSSVETAAVEIQKRLHQLEQELHIDLTSIGTTTPHDLTAIQKNPDTKGNVASACSSTSMYLTMSNDADN